MQDSTDASTSAVSRAHERALAAMAQARQLRPDSRNASRWSMTRETCGRYPDVSDTRADLRWWDDVKQECVMGDEMSVELCRKSGNLDWVPNPSTGVARCLITDDYCVSKGQVLVDGDCTVDFQSFFLEQIVGQTISHGINWVVMNPDKAVEGAVALWMQNFRKVPGMDELDAAANKLGLGPYTQGAKDALEKYWESPVGRTAFRSVGMAVREMKRKMAFGTPYMQKGMDFVGDYIAEYVAEPVVDHLKGSIDDIKNDRCDPANPTLLSCNVYGARRAAEYLRNSGEMVGNWGSSALSQVAVGFAAGQSAAQAAMDGVRRAAERAAEQSAAAAATVADQGSRLGDVGGTVGGWFGH